MQIRSAAKWIAAAAGILVGAVIVGFTLKDTTYIEAKLEQTKEQDSLLQQWRKRQQRRRR